MASMLSQPAPISGTTQLIPVGLSTPYFVEATYAPSAWTHANLKLWIWTGYYNSNEDGDPNFVFLKEKVSGTDDYILFELSEYISSLIDPQFNISSGYVNPYYDGVWFYYEIDYLFNPNNDAVTTPLATTQSLLYFATLGWNWASELQAPVNPSARVAMDKLNYNAKTKYFQTTVNVASPATTDEVFSTTAYTPTNTTICNKDPYVLVYINKQGFWDQFTPVGKVVESQTINREEYMRTFRNPLQLTGREHQTIQYNVNGKSEWTINTGVIKAEAVSQFEELCYSPKVYLLKYDVNTNIGGFFADPTIIPVVVSDSPFERKNRANNKANIVYTFKVKAAYDRVRNIR